MYKKKKQSVHFINQQSKLTQIEKYRFNSILGRFYVIATLFERSCFFR